MKKLFTEDGMALIILIVAILITALIGAGITSFMASKKSSADLPIYSHQAYLLAHAGIEFTTRYIHDNKETFALNPPASYANFIPQYGASGNPANLCTAVPINETYWKRIYFPSGFTKDDKGELFISLEGNCSDLCTLHSCGRYGAAAREVKLYNFQEYY